MKTKRTIFKPVFVALLANWLIVLGAFYPVSLLSQSSRPSPSDIETQIKNLESDNYQIRESAEKALIRIGVPSARSLAEQVIIGSPESAIRSARILQDVGVRANDESEMLRLACVMDYFAKNGFPHFQNSATHIARRWKREQAERIRAQIKEYGIDFPDSNSDDPFMAGGMQVVRGRAIIHNGVIVRGGGQMVIINNGFVLEEEPVNEAPVARPSIRPDREQLSAEIEEIFNADRAAISQRMKQAVMDQNSVVPVAPPDPFSPAHPQDIRVFDNVAFTQPSATIKKVDENTLKGLDLMQLLPAVPQIAFNECEIPADVVEQLAKVPGLQVLSLTRCTYDPERLLELLETNPNLAIDATGHDAFLGVSVQASTLLTDPGVQIQVCEVQTVVEKSAAADAGIQVGDNIMEIDGMPVADFSHLIICIASHQVGDEVTLKFESNGEVREVQITLRVRPALE